MTKQIMGALGLAALVGLANACNSPIKNMPEGGKSITVPAECAELKSTSYDEVSTMTHLCKDDTGQDIIYRVTINDITGGKWKRYVVVREKVKFIEGH